MKEFNKKFLVFFGGLLPLFLWPFLLPSNNLIYTRAKQEINNIFIGDSHVQLSINDNILSNTANFAINSESTYFSYYKLKKILSENSNIKKIYLGFSYHNISSYYDEFIYGKRAQDILPRYFDLLPFREKLRCMPLKVSVFYRNYINIKKNGINHGYDNKFISTSAIKKHMIKRVNTQFFTDSGDVLSFSEINIQYLKKIKDLVRTEDIELIILKVPVHPYYSKLIPNEYIEKFNNLMLEHQLVTLDFNSIVLDDSCFIPDGDHVSLKGADILSSYLKNKE